MCCWSIPQYGEWQGWNLLQINVKLLSAEEVKQGVHESAKSSKRADFWGMLVLWFHLEMRVVIQNIWKTLNLLKEYELLSDPIFFFFSSARQKRSSYPFLLKQIKPQTFKTCFWPPGNLTQGLCPRSSLPIKVPFIDRTARVKKNELRSLLCWGLMLYLRS